MRMADNKRESIEEYNSSGLTVKINVDVSEALTGLKAVERQAKAAKRAVAELDGEYNGPWFGINPPNKGTGIPTVSELCPNKLSDYSTKELADELAKREGVEEYSLDAVVGYGKIEINNPDEGRSFYVQGPARIVVNRD
jgi:hypothetical protein